MFTIVNRSFKHNASFIGRNWPTIRRNKSLRPPSPSPSLQARDGRSGPKCGAPGGGDLDPTSAKCPPSGSSAPPPRLHASTSQDSVGREENSVHDLLCEDEDGRWHELTARHKSAVRAIRKVSDHLFTIIYRFANFPSRIIFFKNLHHFIGTSFLHEQFTAYFAHNFELVLFMYRYTK